MKQSIFSLITRNREACFRGEWFFPQTQKGHIRLNVAFLIINPATTYAPTQLARAVPSAQRGLTSVFGMGTGVTLAV